ncbi:MAG TPA: HlyD family efflux transporter periplasmic adaptor subunit [Aquabacterium sp.]|nr:HlyD family efflux transporter periplasmic adaptor subunit [Aquabacterium sp.]
MIAEPPAAASALPLPIVDRRRFASLTVHPTSRTVLRRRTAAVFALAVAAGAAGLLIAGGGAGTRAHDAARAQPAPPGVVALGRLAPLGELRSLATPFGAADARVAEVLVTEGQHVSAGATLVVFDNAAALQAAWRVADEQLASRRAALAQVERNVLASQAESGAALARAEVAARAAETEYQRWAALVGQGFVSPAAADQRRALRDEAAEELRRAHAVAARHAGEGAAQPELQAARQAVAVAMAERDRAAQDRTRSLLVAPADGTVVAIHTRPGERPGAAGALDFGDTRSMTAELELYQGDVARVRVGQRVRLRSPALDEELVGQISHLGLSVGRQQRIDTSPAANLDARVVKATVALDTASSARARSLVGLEVRAHIETGSP